MKRKSTRIGQNHRGWGCHAAGLRHPGGAPLVFGRMKKVAKGIRGLEYIVLHHIFHPIFRMSSVLPPEAANRDDSGR